MRNNRNSVEVSKDRAEYANCEDPSFVCCDAFETSAPPPVRKLKNTYKPECGRHNPKGLATLAKNPQDKEKSTNFGEWPFACLLYKINEGGGSDQFVGGASLITPGVLVTGANKVK